MLHQFIYLEIIPDSVINPIKGQTTLRTPKTITTRVILLSIVLGAF